MVSVLFKDCEPTVANILKHHGLGAGELTKALYQELFSKNQQVRLHGDHYIACPEDWFSKILEKLYGGSVGL